MSSSSARSPDKRHGAPLWVLILLMLLAVGLWSVWNAYRDYQQVMAQEYSLLEVRAKQSEARISGALRSVSLMQGSIIADLQDHPNTPVDEKIHLLDNYLRQLPEIRSLLVVDATGRVSAFNSKYQNLIGLDVSNREYFTFHRSAPEQNAFHVSLPFKNATNATITTLSRVVRDKQGRFAGVVAAALEASFFDAALTSSETGNGLQFALIHLNGDILNFVDNPALIGKSLKGGIGYTEHMNAGQSTTRHLNTAKLDQIRKLAIFHNVPNAPLAVIVSRDYDNVMADWYQSLYGHVISYVLLTLTTLFLVAVASRRQQSLVRAQKELSAIIETEPECVKQLAADGTLLQMNRAGLDMIEADSFAQVAGEKMPKLVKPEYRSAFMALTKRVFAGESGRLIFEIQGLKGNHRWLETHAVPLRDSDERITALLGITRDITERKQHEVLQEESKRQLELQLTEIKALHAKLEEQVIRDALTNLYNRRYVDETLPRELSRAKREGYSLALVMLDLDRFKQVNDTYGHAAGDEVLKTLSMILIESARESDIVSRYGGEEFLVALPRMSVDQALTRVEEWRQKLAALPIKYGDLTIAVTLSAGIAAFPDHGGDVDTLIAKADAALYSSKNQGRNRVTCHPAD